MNAYAYWKAAVAGEKPKMFVDDPQCGFYRKPIYTKEPNKAAKRTGWSPVAIFKNPLTDGTPTLVAVIGANVRASAEYDRDKINELWSYIAGNPISEETYRAVAERGEPWPDSHEIASIPVANSTSLDDEEITVIVDPNLKDPEPKKYILTASEAAAAKAQGIDLAEAARKKYFGHKKIEEKIFAVNMTVGKYKLIESDEASSQARSLQQACLDLRAEAKEEYDILNRPLLDEQKRIREIWFPLIERADEISTLLRNAMGAWEDTKRRAALVAAERAEAGHEPVQSNVPPPSTQIRGGTGRAANVSVETVVVSIDVDQIFAQFKTTPQMLEFLTGLAQKAIKAGVPVPGAITEQRSVVK